MYPQHLKQCPTHGEFSTTFAGWMRSEWPPWVNSSGHRNEEERERWRDVMRAQKSGGSRETVRQLSSSWAGGLLQLPGGLTTHFHCSVRNETKSPNGVKWVIAPTQQAAPASRLHWIPFPQSPRSVMWRPGECYTHKGCVSHSRNSKATRSWSCMGRSC